MTTRSVKSSTQVHQGKRTPSKSAAKRVGSRRQFSELPAPNDAAFTDETPDIGLLDTTLVTAEDIEADIDWSSDPIETLPELEREIGIADWIDPQTGEPAEGQSPPHLDEE